MIKIDFPAVTNSPEKNSAVFFIKSLIFNWLQMFSKKLLPASNSNLNFSAKIMYIELNRSSYFGYSFAMAVRLVTSKDEIINIITNKSMIIIIQHKTQGSFNLECTNFSNGKKIKANSTEKKTGKIIEDNSLHNKDVTIIDKNNNT